MASDNGSTTSATEGCSPGNVPYYGVFELPGFKHACQGKSAYPSSVQIQHYVMEILRMVYAWCSSSSIYLRPTAVCGCLLTRSIGDTGFVVSTIVHFHLSAHLPIELYEGHILLKKSQHAHLVRTFDSR